MDLQTIKKRDHETIEKRFVANTCKLLKHDWALAENVLQTDTWKLWKNELANYENGLANWKLWKNELSKRLKNELANYEKTAPQADVEN